MPADPEILRRIEALSRKLHSLATKAQMHEQKERALYTAKYLDCLGMMVAQDKIVFDVEPWHPLAENSPLSSAGEMLLRVKDFQGKPLPPYEAVMALYSNGFTEEFDTLLCLCALNQFRQGEDRQVSINISCRSLQNQDFVKTVNTQIEKMRLKLSEKIILEIHESNAVIEVPKRTSDLFRKNGVVFAMDDVGLSINDVFRLSAFEGIADYIKLDRQTVNGNPDDPKALAHILSLAHSILPNAQMVAEGIQNAGHAQEVLNAHPNVRFVQGLYLPDRATFKSQWRDIRSAAYIKHPDKQG
jgi:EAL domain-containing protein (putative c-di-GMP-specific phosphodiesterase class I)